MTNFAVAKRYYAHFLMYMKINRTLTYLLAALFIPALISCSDYLTYAEQLEEMEENIKTFMANHNYILTDSIPTAVPWIDSKGNPLFYKTESGLYLNVVDTGLSSSTKDRQVVEVRYKEMSVEDDSTTYSNFGPYAPAEICNGVVYTAYSSSYFWGDCSGWHEPLDYVGDGGAVRIIVPSDLGMPVYANSSTHLYAYYYYLEYTYWK